MLGEGGSWDVHPEIATGFSVGFFVVVVFFLRGRLETVPQKSFLLRRVLKQQVCKPVLVVGWGLK